jgi:hypothetical protein
MALAAGTVSISAAGVATKSGLAEAIYDNLKARADAEHVIAGKAPPSGPNAVKALKVMGNLATDLANAIVTYMVANTEVVIGTGASGLQRTPSPNDANTATRGPSAERTLPIR